VVLSNSRGPETLRDLVSELGPKARAATPAEAAAAGDIVVVTVPLRAYRDVPAAPLAGKVVIDVTNPLDFSTGVPRLYVGFDDSLGEQVQRWIPKARVVKAFNTVGNAHMINPDFPSGPPDMFLCGNDDDAKKIVTQVCKHWGWGVIDLGGIESSRYLEPMCMTWVLYGVKNGSWNHAFKMLRK